jgi:hypothetical protein
MRSQLNAGKHQNVDMRGRRPKAVRLKVVTGNPGSTQSINTSRSPNRQIRNA